MLYLKLYYAMKYIKLYEDFQLGDLNFMSPEEIQKFFMKECEKKTPDLNLIRVILDNGLVDVNAKWDGKTPLHVAVRGGNIALAEYLISAGADVNTKDRYGDSPLHYATYRDNEEIAKLLISAGADVNAKNDIGMSPLEVAVYRDNVEMQSLLKQHGAVE